MNRQSGFTLIELMIVVAIIGILSSIALSAYQDYTTKAKVTEALVAMTPAKHTIGEHRMATGGWPDQASSGVSVDVGSKYVNSVLWDQAERTLIVKLAAISTVIPENAQFLMEATMTGSDAAVDWDCQPDSFPAKFLPSECRDVRFP